MAKDEDPIVEHLDVPYGPDEAHKIDIYQPLKASSLIRKLPLLVFVHGGAWHTGSRKDHAEMARRLIQLCDVTVAVVDYRLTKPKPLSSWSDASKPIEYENRHPTQIKDVFRALRFLMLPAKLAKRLNEAEDGGKRDKRTSKKTDKKASDKARTNDDEEKPASKKVKREADEDEQDEVETATKYHYDDSRVVLAGHSIGAWIIAATLLSPQICHSWLESLCSKDFENPIPMVCPDDLGATQELTKKIRAWVLLDGIYDLPSLLEEYPSYREFVEQAFPLENTTVYGSEEDQLKAASITSWTCFTERAYHRGDGPHMWLCHSTDDELISLRQSDEAYKYLRKEVVRFFSGHPPGYDSDESQGTSYAPYAPARLEYFKKSWGSHDGMLTNSRFLTFLADVIEEETEVVKREEERMATLRGALRTPSLSPGPEDAGEERVAAASAPAPVAEHEEWEHEAW